MLLVLLLLTAPLLSPAQRRPTPASKPASVRQQPAVPKSKAGSPKPQTVPGKARSAKGKAPIRKPGSLATVLPGDPAFTQYLHSPWVDSLMRVLTPNQRAAQLFMVAAYSNRKRIDEDSISALIQQYGIGG